MKIQLVFKNPVTGPPVITVPTGTAGTLIEVETVEKLGTDDLQALWTLEQTFNNVTRGRLHVSLKE